ncbi:hypothetical protein CDAR_113181 [Caerostris darwini]|uniref:Uncharacterized protein n=1 Tax=Caerostris darwini TaxID=1538125 RepID=A0AAV4PXL6_9ARAC|nr:hypothetical protein CDAR_113181 [Caerostris darwini]
MPELTEPRSKTFFPLSFGCCSSNNSQLFLFFYSSLSLVGLSPNGRPNITTAKKWRKELVKTFAWKRDNRTMAGKSTRTECTRMVFESLARQDDEEENG